MGRKVQTLADLKPQRRNANRHTERGMTQLERSIQADGYLTPMTAAADGEVFDGSARLEKAAQLFEGVEPIVVESDGTRPIVHIRTDIPTADDPKAARLALAANRVAQANLEWDTEVLAQLKAEGATEGMFEDAELAEMFGTPEVVEGAGGDDFDTTPSDGPTRCQPGDLWKLGEHRLLCGDSTNAEDVGRVMQGQQAAVCLTDPPYGLGDSATEKNNYAEYEDTRESLARLVAGFLPLAREAADIVVLTSGNANHRMYPQPTWTMAWFVPAGTGRGPWGFCCWQPILCYGKDPKLSSGLGSFPDAIVHTERAEDNGHPCAKPIKFWMWLMERASNDEGDLIYDPFCGSGTTLIAAQRLNRRCYAIEISPTYCDVILRRWEAETGQVAERIEAGVAHVA